MQKQFSFNKKEKLKSKKLLQQLFSTGKSFNVYPIKIIYSFVNDIENDAYIKVGVGTSTKNFKKATKRNRIKRLLRENYRLQKTELVKALHQSQKKIVVFFLYLDKEMPNYEILQTKMKISLEKLTTIIPS